MSQNASAREVGQLARDGGILQPVRQAGKLNVSVRRVPFDADVKLRASDLLRLERRRVRSGSFRAADYGFEDAGRRWDTEHVPPAELAHFKDPGKYGLTELIVVLHRRHSKLASHSFVLPPS